MNHLALKYFRKIDPVLHGVAVKVGEIESIKPSARDNYFMELCEAVVGQQLSGKAADTIFGRVKKLFERETLTPESVNEIDTNKLREAGVSGAKARYLKDLAANVISCELDLDNLDQLEDKEVMSQLTRVKGIGPWTAEMFLMFTLGREDIFSPGDQGLKNAIKKLPGLKKPLVWSPYRSWASRVLWRSLELK